MAKHKAHNDPQETPDTSHISNPDVAHEVSDVNIRAILQFVAGLLIFSLITLGLMWLLMNFLETIEARNDPPSSPMALRPEERLPPEPRLQVAPGFGVQINPEQSKQVAGAGFDVRDNQRVNLELKEPQAEWKVLRRIWENQLKNGETDPRTGQVLRLPIAEAKRRLVESQPQARPQAPHSPTVHGVPDVDVPSYQSSGRMMEKKDQ